MDFTKKFSALRVNLQRSKTFLYKPWRSKGSLQFENIINILVGSFHFIRIYMLFLLLHHQHCISCFTFENDFKYSKVPAMKEVIHSKQVTNNKSILP